MNSLKPKDRLIRIDNDDVSSWPIARSKYNCVYIINFITSLAFIIVVQRLSDYRVAIGNVVTFQFSRKLRHDGVEEIDEAEEEEARYRASEIIPTEVVRYSTISYQKCVNHYSIISRWIQLLLNHTTL